MATEIAQGSLAGRQQIGRQPGDERLVLAAPLPIVPDSDAVPRLRRLQPLLTPHLRHLRNLGMLFSVSSGRLRSLLIATYFGGAASYASAQYAEPSGFRYRRMLDLPSSIKGGTIQPRWLADSDPSGTPSRPRIEPSWSKSHPVRATRERLLDGARVRSWRIGKALGHEPPYAGVPFSALNWADRTEQSPIHARGPGLAPRSDDVRGPVAAGPERGGTRSHRAPPGPAIMAGKRTRSHGGPVAGPALVPHRAGGESVAPIDRGRPGATAHRRRCDRLCLDGGRREMVA